MKFTLDVLTKLKPTRHSGGKRGWPGHLFGGHVRTSTVVLLVAFVAVWWTYDTYRPPPPEPPQLPARQVVPPGFVPDPDYTWVPRTRVREYPPTSTPTETRRPAITTPTTTVPKPSGIRPPLLPPLPTVGPLPPLFPPSPPGSAPSTTPPWPSLPAITLPPLP